MLYDAGTMGPSPQPAVDWRGDCGAALLAEATLVLAATVGEVLGVALAGVVDGMVRQEESRSTEVAASSEAAARGREVTGRGYAIAGGRRCLD